MLMHTECCKMKSGRKTIPWNEALKYLCMTVKIQPQKAVDSWGRNQQGSRQACQEIGFWEYRLQKLWHSLKSLQCKTSYRLDWLDYKCLLTLSVLMEKYLDWRRKASRRTEFVPEYVANKRYTNSIEAT